MTNNTPFSNYIKVEQFKNVVATYIYNMGLKKEVRALSDKDMDLMIRLMATMNRQLKSQKNDKDRIDLLVSSTIYLWTKLLLEHGLDLKDIDQ